MNNSQHKNQPQEQFPDVLDELSKLRQAIDSQAYPGQAWPVQHIKSRPFARPAIAAAAAIIVAAGLGLWFYSNKDLPEQQDIPEKIVQTPSNNQTTWTAPTNIGLSVAGSVKLEVPSISIPSAGDFGGLGISVPSISFPSLTEKRSNHNGI